ncbi:MAG: hypothetical protein PHP82_02815 [Candidatus ainarchaeum sp.]|nr:hypothetical protein [Candidatus ainarchaeum sp.]
MNKKENNLLIALAILTGLFGITSGLSGAVFTKALEIYPDHLYTYIVLLIILIFGLFIMLYKLFKKPKLIYDFA